MAPCLSLVGRHGPSKTKDLEQTASRREEHFPRRRSQQPLARERNKLIQSQSGTQRAQIGLIEDAQHFFGKTEAERGRVDAQQKKVEGTHLKQVYSSSVISESE